MSKRDVLDFWQQESCGEVYARGESVAAQLQSQALARYELEPYIPRFARFEEGRGLAVLEIGVGMGADHLEWARQQPRRLVGLDATKRALAHTQRRLSLAGYTPELIHGDAEQLPFPSGIFDIVYSWGVLHHTPDTPGAIREVLRVLKPGGTARVMIYHRRSIVGLLLWLKYALLAGRPFRSLDDVYAHHLESPGTKAYSVGDARRLFAGFGKAAVTPFLSFADLLQGAAGARHGGQADALARKLWPRWLIQQFFGSCGLYLLVEARKDGEPAS
jgi:SAM-dependent methyltransferase